MTTTLIGTFPFYIMPGCYFDTTAAANVSTSSTATSIDVVLEFRDTATNGTGAGESLDDDGDNSPQDGWRDGSPNFSVVSWVYTAKLAVTTTVFASDFGPQLFPTPAFDWNCFTWYSTYVVFRDVESNAQL